MASEEEGSGEAGTPPADGGGRDAGAERLRALLAEDVPLAEIAGEARHPISGERFSDMWAAFDADSQPMQRVDWPPA